MKRVQRKKLFLIGYGQDDIRGSKLPSRKDCLKLLHFLTNSVEPKLTMRKGANKVVEKCFEFWERANIPTLDKPECVRKLLDLHRQWKTLGENQCLKTETKKFEQTLDDLFDIAHERACEMIELEEDRHFLMQQRKPGRPGSMLGVDRKSTRTKKARAETDTIQDSRPIAGMDVDVSVSGCSNQRRSENAPAFGIGEVIENSRGTIDSSTFTLPIIKNVTSVSQIGSSDEDVVFVSTGSMENADDELLISESSFADVTSTSDIGGSESYQIPSGDVELSQLPPICHKSEQMQVKIEKATNPADQSTDADFIGRYWADESKKIKQPEQILWAKKFISDILVEGQLGSLHRDAVHLRVPDTSRT